MKKIVVVDDDENILEAVEIVLSNRGYQVIVVEDPTQALDVIKAQQPHLVLLDLYLAGFDGRELLTQLKQDMVLAHIPVVLMSADATLTHESTKATAVLKKPFALTELETILETYSE